MTAEQIAELVIRPSAAGIRTDSDRWDIDFIVSILDIAAAQAKRVQYKQERNLPNQWLYTKWLTYNQYEQDTTEYIRFNIPNQINLSDGLCGITLVKGSKGNTIPVYKSVAEYLSAQNHPFFRNKGYEQVAVINGKELRIYGTQAIKYVEVKGLFTDVINDPDFNLRYDDYPITDDIIWAMNAFILQQYGNPIENRPLDVLPDGTDTVTSQSVIK